MIWVDNVLITARGDVPIVTLVCTHVVHGQQVEAARITVTVSHLERMGKTFTDLAERYKSEVTKAMVEAGYKDPAVVPKKLAEVPSSVLAPRVSNAARGAKRRGV